ncbi:hypothetical protein AGROH133_06285 [Agrobacterium tumefaciens]|nr:hypothetical protein AGROH133_06285 [Agrobacterium tumefaciens]
MSRVGVRSFSFYVLFIAKSRLGFAGAATASLS